MNRMNLNRRTLLGGAAAAAAGAVVGTGRAFAADQKFVPYSNKSLDYYFFVAQEEAVKRAVESKGWRFQAVNASFDNTTQLQQWESILLNGPSAIVSGPLPRTRCPGCPAPQARRPACGRGTGNPSPAGG